MTKNKEKVGDIFKKPLPKRRRTKKLEQKKEPIQFEEDLLDQEGSVRDDDALDERVYQLTLTPRKIDVNFVDYKVNSTAQGNPFAKIRKIITPRVKTKGPKILQKDHDQGVFG